MDEPASQFDEKRARERLLRERRRIEADLTEQERIHRSEVGEIETATDPADDAELIEEEQVDDAVAEQLRMELAAIERAVKRLDEGTYGRSIESGDPIPGARLDAIPWAERTADEQARYERGPGRGP